MFQRYSVVPHLTVLQNVLLGRLFGARHKFPNALSGGMQQRLSIAQSIVKQPKTPFGGISADMHRLILRLWDEHQMTTSMITHDLKEGFELGTRLPVFDKTRLNRCSELASILSAMRSLGGPCPPQHGAHGAPYAWLRIWTYLDMQAPKAYGATITYDIPLHVTTPALVRQWMRRISPELDSISAAGMIPPVRAWPAVYPPRCRLVSDGR